MWTYQGKEEEDGHTYDGKMHAERHDKSGYERGQHDIQGSIEE